MIRVFEFVRECNGRVWHIGQQAGHSIVSVWTLCSDEWALRGEDAKRTDLALPDLPDGGRLCASCARELERRTRGSVVRRGLCEEAAHER